MKTAILIFFTLFGLQASADEVQVSCIRARYYMGSFSTPDPEMGNLNTIAIQKNYADGTGFEVWKGEINHEIPSAGAFSSAIPFILKIKQARDTICSLANRHPSESCLEFFYKGSA